MARKPPHEWLHQELRSWQSAGLITAEQAAALQARYPLEERRRAWGTIIFSSLGAVIIGLGIILLFAYNWDKIPKFGKLALIFSALAAAHATGISLFLRSSRYRALGEGVCLLASMMFGAGLWLVAQVYHIEEHYPTAFLVWGLGAGLMAWALPSVGQGVLATILLTIWCGVEAGDFGNHIALGPLLIVIFGGLAFVLKSRLLLAVVLPALLVSAAFGVPAPSHAWCVFTVVLGLSALFIAAGLLLRTVPLWAASAAVFEIYGWGTFLVMGYLLTFPEFGKDLLRTAFRPSPLLATYGLVPLLLCLAGWIAVAHRRHRVSAVDPPAWGYQLGLIPLAVLLAYYEPLVYLIYAGSDQGWVIAAPFNLVFLGLAVGLMARGCRAGLLRPTALGSILLVALATARYFDLFESLLARGLVFVAVGALVFTEGILYARARKLLSGGRPP